MTKKEFEQFLQYIFDEYIRNKIQNLSDYRILGNEWEGLKKSAHIIRYINRYCNDSNDINNTFTNECLKRLVKDIENGVNLHNHIAELAGFLDALDAHYLEILEGLQPEYLHESELKILKDLGSTEPETELAGMIYSVKGRKYKTIPKLSYDLLPSPFHLNNPYPYSPLPTNFDYHPKAISSLLAKIPSELSQAEIAIQSPNEKMIPVRPPINPPVSPPVEEITKKRWYKGAGKITQGIGTSLCDIAFGTAATATGIAIPIGGLIGLTGAALSLGSVIIGVGFALEGLGELRSE